MTTALLISVVLIVAAILIPKPHQRDRMARIDALLDAAERRKEPSPRIERD
ncbi:hypothetical protein SEA_GUUELAD_116 [Mycobacterium phage GuuelaD]|uniref:Uncharacterized protein n=1 Tax=Mycobacterium phage GuuelaD TaxID=2015819 RepID=A0A286MQL6_9CAUD|nr:hypothetical protein J4T97_gp123 [Mycobacterium phage GuuelaD]ASW31541.1 hypothetical protein SEA_GUUELAD_116 [Mycobacterium phage GuuelaD]